MDDSDFSSKRKALFDCLDSAERGLAGSSLQQAPVRLEDFERSQQKPRSKFQKPKLLAPARNRKESLFKRPALPINKCLAPRRTPDYQVNPHKWKKYSLEDVDCSDRTNSSAAFSFLREIERRKEAEEEQAEEASSKIVFKKSVKLKPEVESSEEAGRSVARGSKIVMPEYVVGQKRKTPKTEKKVRTEKDKRNQMKLDHLMEDEEED